MINLPTALRPLFLPLLALFAIANAGAATIGTPQRYTLDASASNVSAKVPFFGIASKTARFPKMRGGATITANDPGSTTLEVTLDERALTAPDSVTLARLKSDKFFWVDRYPEIHFTARGLKMRSATSGTMPGNVTTRGVTRPVSLNVEFARAPDAVRAGGPLDIVATTRIDRRDFNMTAYSLIVGDAVEWAARYGIM